jgi:hypothetical protein
MMGRGPVCQRSALLEELAFVPLVASAVLGPRRSAEHYWPQHGQRHSPGSCTNRALACSNLQDEGHLRACVASCASHKHHTSEP